MVSQSTKKSKVLIIRSSRTKNELIQMQDIITNESSLDIKLLHYEIKVGYSMHSDYQMSDLKNHISRCNPHMIIILALTATDELQCRIINIIRSQSNNIPVLIILDNKSDDNAVSFIKCGANEFIFLPFKRVDLVARIRRFIVHAKHRSEVIYTLKEKIGLDQIVGKHPLFLNETRKIPTVAQCDANVLLKGETGTGKEIVARSIHYLSARSEGPFIPVNCGAIPSELVENELFGHIKGAYTSANTSQGGLIHEADGGTLLLDEVDSLPLSSQVKLLRFLNEKEYKRLGSSRILRADVRIIAASNSNLEEKIKKGSFRSDLYYRLNIIPLVLPPLRERKTDIPLLANHFLDKYSSGSSKTVREITGAAVQKLMMYDWPGNVRELEHIIERAVIFSAGKTIESEDISISICDSRKWPETFKEAKARAVTQFEIEYIQNLLHVNQGNITKAARAAQKNRRAFWELIRKYNIDVSAYVISPPGQDNPDC